MFKNSLLNVLFVYNPIHEFSIHFRFYQSKKMLYSNITKRIIYYSISIMIDKSLICAPNSDMKNNMTIYYTICSNNYPKKKYYL